MSEDTKKTLERKFGDQVQETQNSFINSDYIIKSHELIQQGFAVYLLSQGTNTPYKGSRGHLDATNNVRELTDMFLKYGANSNIGIILKDTGLVVLDIDRHSVQTSGLNTLRQAGVSVSFDNEAVEVTPRGLHVFFKIPDGLDISKLKRNIGTGLELITDKITVAPSVKNGEPYKHLGRSFSEANVMPDWLIDLSSNVATSGSTQTGRVPKYSVKERWEMILNGFVQGQRNNMCVSLSGYLLRINVDPNIAYAIVKKVNANSDVPLADKEVETIYRSAYQREKQRRLGGR
ncbi:prophage Lp4 protein 7, DNA replication [Leuconostoc kimchii IMSNU 11154]|uniref:Prophage Lp4 protein 7, DNA replication n=1 Tax=Leuconostoc kimchii (strain IMSNU 11154 / KCTC 2386 / IH25) TaxID=762051 RepID=D5T225_LEUKI|nr:bifunctional DNA primase/polymerase [Leuconostoc kimchii]ADG40324.1 prophage Lp4 protein 7, DNA replication [Leuconostoc kimchii IMSNU 11154]